MGWIGEFDGASRGNPGEAGAGALLADPSGRVVWEVHRHLGRRTNNEAEYAALLLLLEEAVRLGLEELEVRGDSRLVVEQVNGRWKISALHLRPLAARARELLAGRKVRLYWVPRERNRRADVLSNRAIDEAKESGPNPPESSGTPVPVLPRPSENG
jgi:ribonuclease HI